MTTAWPDVRKIAELRAKLASLEEEFGHWRAESAEGERLRKHHTQIEKVTSALDALRLRIERELDSLAAGAPPAGGNVVDVETMILDVHRIWEFFRSKLSQRFVTWFQPFLVAADQFAWDCYDPMRGAIDPAHVPAADVREPPMVFFNGGWSPFTLSRGIEYEAEYVPEEDVDKAQYRAILEDLPFPVIGVPWYQVRHLPDAVLLGHEVGHAIEGDFKLTGRLRALLAAAFEARPIDGDHREAWYSWLGEIFADVWGTLAGGEAFAGALMDLVAGPVDQITTEAADPLAWGIYPPAALRVETTLAALAESGFPTESETLWSRWTATYPHHAMESFSKDARPIVEALIRSPIAELKDQPIIKVLQFTAQAKGVAATREYLEHKLAPQTADARTLLATARLAFEASPEAYATNTVQQRILDSIAKGQDRSTRIRSIDSRGEAVEPESAVQSTLGVTSAPERDAQALELADRLFEALTRLRS